MNDERAIGRLEAEVSNIKNDVLDIKKDVKTLLAWRWKLWGTTAVIGVVSAAGFQLILAFFGR